MEKKQIVYTHKTGKGKSVSAEKAPNKETAKKPPQSAADAKKEN